MKYLRHALSAAMLWSFAFLPVTAFSQAKPPDSATKIKRVLLYNKIGGWVHTDGSNYVKEMMRRNAVAKGFELVQLNGDSLITLDYLRQFQVIVWNNNVSGRPSVPNDTARKAVIDYVHQGGGWMLIHGAGFHESTWPGLDSALGTTGYRWAPRGKGELLRDSAAILHKELKYMVFDRPAVDTLLDEWQAYRNTVRPLPRVTVVATSRSIPASSTGIVYPPQDGSMDNAYIWAREVGQGRLIFNSIGHGRTITPETVFDHQDSSIYEMYWQNLRYAAGDFENGCTDVNSLKYSPSARVDDGSCVPASGLTKGSKALSGLNQIGRKLVFSRLAAQAVSLQLLNMSGKVVWQKTLVPRSRELVIDESVSSGLYQLNARENLSTSRYKLLIP